MQRRRPWHHRPHGHRPFLDVLFAWNHGVGVVGRAEGELLSEGRPGLIFGYATLGERALAEGIEILAEAMSEVRSR
jgi:GntR family transcriptional regulator/MocR family aminotransferase